MRYQPVIGLEIHAELLTDSKVFCTCQNEFGGSENTRVCPRCSGLPGTLPLLNQGAVRLAAKAGFALDCTVNNYSAFDRKNYFYPDLPKAYQITVKMYLADIYTVTVNIAGLPAISTTCGYDSKGLPIGMSLIGKAFDEKTIIAVCDRFEKDFERKEIVL